jgi:hypothetical protein
VEIYVLHSRPNIIPLLKSGTISYGGGSHVASVEATRGAYKVLVGRLEIMNHLEDLGIDERIILKWV